MGRQKCRPNWSHKFILKTWFCKPSQFQESPLKSLWSLPRVFIYRSRHCYSIRNSLWSACLLKLLWCIYIDINSHQSLIWIEQIKLFIANHIYYELCFFTEHQVVKISRMKQFNVFSSPNDPSVVYIKVSYQNLNYFWNMRKQVLRSCSCKLSELASNSFSSLPRHTPALSLSNVLF